MTKSAIERKEMIISFISSTNKLIDEEGIENVTARKIAHATGYNVATAYKYFKNLNHILFFACMKYYNLYIQDLPNYISEDNSSLENYLGIWKCFSIHAFNNPKIFKSIFLDQGHLSVKDTMKEYYEIFPNELKNLPTSLSKMLDKDYINERDLAILEVCIKDGYINQEDVKELSENVIIFFEGLLMKVTNHVDGYSKKRALEIILKFIYNTLHYYNLKSSNVLSPFLTL